MGESPAPPRGGGLLGLLGLGKPEHRAWAMYDWANSAFSTTVMGAIFPIYFERVVALGMDPRAATARFAWATTAGLALSAILSPFLGALADFAAVKKRLLGAFLALGALSTAGLFFCGPGDVTRSLLLFALANIGASGSSVFYDSLLPHIAREDEIDRVSSAGFALGYLGGGLLFALNCAWVWRPEAFGIPGEAAASRLSFLSVAVWWTAFSLPLFRRVPEPPRVLEADEREGMNAVRVALVRLRETLRSLRTFRHALLFLVAFLVFNDGIGTIMRMASIYGAGELGLASATLTGAFLLVQFLGIPFAFGFGALAGRIGAKAAILIGLAVYAAISVFAYFMRTAAHFFVLAVLVAMVQGGTQALSRSLFATLVPRHKASECFAFFSVFEKFAGVLGPLAFAAAISLTGSSRAAILSLIAFFIAGGVLLSFVRVEEGQAAARAAEPAAAGDRMPP